MGTDRYGRDMLSRIIVGAKVSVFSALTLVAAVCAVGTALGVLCGFCGGWLDEAVMRLCDMCLAFPGLVLAILEPEVQVTLLDSQQKRVAFQREVCQTLGLGNVTCLAGRAEEAGELRESFDVVASRAVARLNLLSELCLPLVKKGGLFAAMKGPAPEEELQEAGSALRRLGGGPGRVEKYSIPGTEAVHSLVLVAKVSPTPSGYPRRFALIKKQPL